MSQLRRMLPSFSRLYWEVRYALGGTSGPGSSGKLARFKASVLNTFVREHDVSSVIEFGCGDGSQLELASYPQYVGLDVSRQAIQRCREQFSADDSKSFFLYDPECFVDTHGLFRADLSLSLDVIYHLLEDEIFDLYMRDLFSSADRFVAIYSSNESKRSYSPHIHHRPFTTWVSAHAPQWELLKTVANEQAPSRRFGAGQAYDFFIYEKIPQTETAKNATPYLNKSAGVSNPS